MRGRRRCCFGDSDVEHVPFSPGPGAVGRFSPLSPERGSRGGGPPEPWSGLGMAMESSCATGSAQQPALAGGQGCWLRGPAATGRCAPGLQWDAESQCLLHQEGPRGLGRAGSRAQSQQSQGPAPPGLDTPRKIAGGLLAAHLPNWQMYRFRVLQRWSFQLKAADACISTQFPNLCPGGRVVKLASAVAWQ